MTKVPAQAIHLLPSRALRRHVSHLSHLLSYATPRSGRQPRSTATAHMIGTKRPLASVSADQGPLLLLWQVKDSNLRSLRDGFTVQATPQLTCPLTCPEGRPANMRAILYRACTARGGWTYSARASSIFLLAAPCCPSMHLA
jgi:hypothetical protein